RGLEGDRQVDGVGAGRVGEPRLEGDRVAGQSVATARESDRVEQGARREVVDRAQTRCARGEDEVVAGPGRYAADPVQRVGPVRLGAGAAPDAREPEGTEVRLPPAVLANEQAPPRLGVLVEGPEGEVIARVEGNCREIAPAVARPPKGPH